MIYSTKTRAALALVDAFKKPSNRGAAFFSLSRKEVAEGLKRNLTNPSAIDQADAQLCGPASLLYSLLQDNPSEYAQFAIDLFEKGKARLRELEVTPCDDLKKYAPPAGSINQADWLTLASIRDSENWAGPFCYDAISHESEAITWPNEVERWFRKVGYTNVVNKASKWSTQDRNNADEASRKYDVEEYHVVLLINHGIISRSDWDPSHSVFTAPTHYIVLRSRIVIASTVQFKAYSWGDANTPVPPAGRTLSLDDFLGNYFGFIAAKF